MARVHEEIRAAFERFINDEDEVRQTMTSLNENREQLVRYKICDPLGNPWRDPSSSI